MNRLTAQPRKRAPHHPNGKPRRQRVATTQHRVLSNLYNRIPREAFEKYLLGQGFSNTNLGAGDSPPEMLGLG
jgi:hypothetical protein